MQDRIKIIVNPVSGRGKALLLAEGVADQLRGQGCTVDLQKTQAEAERLFPRLADGGEVQMPLTKTFFSPRFGMVADRFGVSWMLFVAR